MKVPTTPILRSTLAKGGETISGKVHHLICGA